MSADVIGYSNIADLLAYKLDKEIATVYISGVKIDDAGKKVCMADWMEKVPADAVEKVKKAMSAEASLLLRPWHVDGKRAADDFLSPDSGKECRTLQTYPTE